METVRFWYTFEDKNGEMSTHDVDISVSNEGGVSLGDVCEAFARFVKAAGFCAENLAEYFLD